MKKHNTANILLIELLIVILFFMLCVAAIVDIFGMARVKSLNAQAISEALLRVENLEEVLASGRETEETLIADGFEQDGVNWILREDGYTLKAAETEEETEAGIIRTVTFTAERGEETVFELPAVHYIPGEVSP